LPVHILAIAEFVVIMPQASAAPCSGEIISIEAMADSAEITGITFAYAEDSSGGEVTGCYIDVMLYGFLSCRREMSGGKQYTLFP
jgi:hypothetical protein